MRYLIWFLLLTLSSAFGSYTNDATTLNGTKGTSSPQNAYQWACVAVDSTTGNSFNSVNIVSNTSSTIAVSVPQITWSNPYYWVLFAGPVSGTSASFSALKSGSGIAVRWLSSYSGSGVSVSGPFAGNSFSNPTDNAGNPANPVNGTSTPPTDYDVPITLTNSSSSVQGYQLIATGSSGQVLAVKNVYLQPNTSATYDFNQSQPFSVSAYQLKPNDQFDSNGNVVGQVWTKTSSTPMQTISATGSTATPPATLSVSQTAENNMATPSATAASAQAQTLQGSDEITGAVKDLAAQDLANGQKLDTTNNLLSGIQTSITGTNTQLGAANGNLTSINSSIAAMSSKVDTVNTSLASVNGTAGSTTNAVNAVGSKIDTTNTQLGTISTGISSGNTALGSVSGKIDTTNTGLNNVNASLNGSNSLLTTISGKLDTIIGNMGGGTADSGASDYAGAGNADTTATGFVNTMMTRFTNVKTAIGNLWLSLGLANTPGTAPLQFTVPLPLGNFDLNFENVASSWIDAARRFELFVMSVLFTITAIKTARSAFV